MKKILLLLFFVLISGFLFHYILVGQAIYGDGIYYWSFTRSLYKDHDIDISNELAHQYNQSENNSFNISTEKIILNKEAAYRQPIGTSISWLIPYSMADMTIHLLAIIGVHFSLNGYSDIYQLFVGIANIGLIIVGVAILYKFLINFFNTYVALLSLLTVFFSTNLLYYSSIDILNSHPQSFFLSVVFIYLWYVTLKKRNYTEWFLLGVIVGFLAATRLQDIVLVSILLYDLYFFFKDRKKLLPSNIKNIISFFVGLFLGIIPELLLLTIIFNNPLKTPYVGETTFNFFAPHFFQVLFDTNVGLLLFSPIIFFCIVGVYFMKQKGMSNIFLLLFLLQLYIISCWSGWNQGESYGIRMMISISPIFVFGLSSFYETFQKRINKKVFFILSLFFIVLNIASIGYYHLIIHAPTLDNGTQTKSGLIKKKLLQNLQSFF